MIGRIRGIIIEKQAPHLLVDVSGVGYELQAPMTTFYRLPAVGQEVVLHTHLQVREDAHVLFGFFDGRERELFRELLKVNGVGPKLALAILSGMEPDVFVKCVQEHNYNALTRLPGVGKKTAERLLIEMRDRLASWAPDFGRVGLSLDASIAAPASNALQDAESALIALGYKPQEASKAVAAVKVGEGQSSEELIRLALKNMVRA